jgi:hypothetical protein
MMPVRWAVLHLCGLPKSRRDKRVLTMLRGFFDESNKNPKEVTFILAGWTASVEEWERFSEAWQACLLEEPSLDYFKSSEARSDPKRIDLANVIASHPLRGYVATVKHEILSNKPKQFRLLKGMAGMRVYDWALVGIVERILVDYLDRGEQSEKIDFVFDDCTELAACIESYRLQKPKWPPSMQHIAGMIAPGDDQNIAGLQAADLFAGEHSAYLRTGQKDAVYMALASVPIVEFPIPPPPVMESLLQYSQDVQQWAEVLHGTLKSLKELGVNLDDFKKDEGEGEDETV